MPTLFRMKLIQTSGHKMAVLPGLSLKHQFLTNGMRNEVDEKYCVYIFYSIPIDSACDASSVWFPLKLIIMDT